MLIFVHGENTYASREHLEKMRAKFASTYDASGMNMVTFPSTDGKLDRGTIFQAIQSPPFLGEKRLVVLNGLLEEATTKAKAEPWLEVFENIQETSIVILFHALPSKQIEKNALFTAFQKNENVHVYDFPLLTGRALTAWAREEQKKLGLHMDAALLERIIGMVGNDAWQISNELKKLAAYCQGRQATAEDVTDLVRANFEDRMFQCMDAMSERKAEKALQLLREQRECGSSDFHIFSLLVRQVRLLLGARHLLDRRERATSAEYGKESGVAPFVAQKAMAQARNFQSEDLRAAHELLYSCDQNIKRGQIAADVAVDRTVLEMVARFKAGA